MEHVSVVKLKRPRTSLLNKSTIQKIEQNNVTLPEVIQTIELNDLNRTIPTKMSSDNPTNAGKSSNKIRVKRIHSVLNTRNNSIKKIISAKLKRPLSVVPDPTSVNVELLPRTATACNRPTSVPATAKSRRLSDVHCDHVHIQSIKSKPNNNDKNSIRMVSHENVNDGESNIPVDPKKARKESPHNGLKESNLPYRPLSTESNSSLIDTAKENRPSSELFNASYHLADKINIHGSPKPFSDLTIRSGRVPHHADTSIQSIHNPRGNISIGSAHIDHGDISLHSARTVRERRSLGLIDLSKERRPFRDRKRRRVCGCPLPCLLCSCLSCLALLAAALLAALLATLLRPSTPTTTTTATTATTATTTSVTTVTTTTTTTSDTTTTTSSTSSTSTTTTTTTTSTSTTTFFCGFSNTGLLNQYSSNASLVWTAGSYSYTATSTTTTLLFSSATNIASKDWWVDNVSIVDPNNPSANLVVNGNFETGTSLGWNLFSCTGGCNTLVESSSSCLGGSGYCYHNACTPASNIQFLQQIINTTIGVTYNVTYWVLKGGSGIGSGTQMFVNIF